MAGGSGASATGADPADLSLTKADSPDPVNVDATLTYTIEVNNAGPDDATNVTVTDDLDPQVDFVSASASQGSCDVTGKKVTCNLGTLANAGKVTITIQVKPKKEGQLENTASVQSGVFDPQPANDQDTETTTVTEPPKPTGPTCKTKPATIVGTQGDDSGTSALLGTDGADVIVGLGGNDEIFSGDGRDLICAGDGDDLTRGGGKADTAFGNGGNDRLKGEAGGDELRGNRGNDVLRGSTGADLLVGGRDVDSCRGGRGRDTLRSCEA